jgi:hypothetical protein
LALLVTLGGSRIRREVTSLAVRALGGGDNGVCSLLARVAYVVIGGGSLSSLTVEAGAVAHEGTLTSGALGTVGLSALGVSAVDASGAHRGGDSSVR